MLFGISAYFLTNNSLSGVIDSILTAGIRVVELSYEPPHLFSLDGEMIGKVRRLAGEGVGFSMHGPFLEINPGSYLDEIRNVSRERLLAAVRLSAEIGADPVVVHPGYSFFRKLKEFDSGLQARFIEDLATVAEEARSCGVRIALENVFMSYFYFQELGEFGAINAAVPGIGVTLDIGHAYISKCAAKHPDPEGGIIDDVRRMGIENLFHVHLHNNDGSRDDHGFVKGSIDMGRVLRGLKGLGYRDKVVIETLDIERFGFAPVMEKLREIAL
ncbi:MAG: sugar phosphate isomerase/epimerase [Syntrophorhabdaceae bacterium]|nr:sugar phosphate isomerase/epimerase [Syntrophorhabdaceae bacterium]